MDRATVPAHLIKVLNYTATVRNQKRAGMVSRIQDSIETCKHTLSLLISNLRFQCWGKPLKARYPERIPPQTFGSIMWNP